ncbi:hypothetical protein L5C66_29480 [Pseudomonas aeruginosa]|uniref:hypothetical protein n=1 Tax=Pseudomonas aeruginosa TaxID=287 RepID=UPI001F25F0DD|nr:hypothetical protein [Pseudomonas aeruginosa]MDG3714537.1 hypothetical protein [Pseudomonas aeruginosa]
MRTRKKKSMPISFGHGCAVSDDIFCVASFLDEVDPEIEYTRVFVLNLSSDSPWMHHDIPGRTIISVALRPGSSSRPRACYVLGDYGQLQIINSTEILEEEIPAAGVEANRNDGLTFSAISHVGDKAYACGAIGRIYRRDDAGWMQVATEISSKAAQDFQSIVVSIGKGDRAGDLREIPNFEHVAGLSDNDIYVCGLNGAVANWNGHSWSFLKIPTRQHLHYIHCYSPDEVYICGHNGTLLRGSAREGFRRVALGRNDINFWTVHKFNETVYVGTTSGLFQIIKSKLQPVNFDLSELPSSFAIQAIDSTAKILWVVADKLLLRLEGGVWQKITHPDNVI